MATKLVIVESPTKAHKIGDYLGKGYTVMASVGHIRIVCNSDLNPQDIYASKEARAPGVGSTTIWTRCPRRDRSPKGTNGAGLAALGRLARDCPNRSSRRRAISSP